MNWIKMDNRNQDKKILRKFAITMAAALLVISALIYWKRGIWPLPVLVIAVSFFILSFLCPGILKPVYIIWMKFSAVLGWINIRILLSAVFYLIFTPLGILLKLLGKDLLEIKIDKNATTYWHKKAGAGDVKQDYARQF